MNMYELTEKELHNIKLIEIDILREIDIICKNHNIKYSLAAGSLLGAVRHKGFIPWDDDVDIMMIRNEYEKFLELCEFELPESLFLVNYKNNKSYGLPFSKIMAKNTVMNEISISKINVSNGIFVDIFPVDTTSINDEEITRQFLKARRLKTIMLCKCKYLFKQNKIKRLIWCIASIILKLIPKEFLIRKFEKNAVKYSKEQSSDYISLCGDASKDKSILPKEWFEKYSYLKFENNKFLSIAQSKQYLKLLYNDYNVLPPINKRIPHHFVTDFDITKYIIKETKKV